MFLLAVKRKYIISLTILMVVLSWGGALVFHTLLPRYYFAWYPSIPIFFYLFGLFYIFMFVTFATRVLFRSTYPITASEHKYGGGLLGGESDEDDVEHLDYVRLCSGGGTSSTVIYRNLHGILYYLSDF